MPALTAGNERQNPLSVIVNWWRNLTGRRAAVHELNCCGEEETAHIARDVGVAPSELRILVGKWPDRADLLARRIAAIGLQAEHVQATEPEVMRDLQRVCGHCSDRSRCNSDLTRDESDRTWRDYCPNVSTFDALRTEQRDRRLLRRRRKWRSF